MNSVSVLVGAIPGALPCLIGWLAALEMARSRGRAAGCCSPLQFLWQFPHFWAIAWLAHKDYTTAGFKLLPADKGLPVHGDAKHHLQRPDDTGWFSALLCRDRRTDEHVHPAGLQPGMVYVSVLLFIRMDAASARRVMFSSYFYLMIVLLALFANRG